MYTIKQFAQILDVPVSTVRYYERTGLIQAKRKENNYRIYDLEDIQRLKLVLVMKYVGFSLKEIQLMLSLSDFPDADCIAKTHSIIMRKRSEISSAIESYQSIIALLDMLRPLVIQDTSDENTERLSRAITQTYQQIKKDDNDENNDFDRPPLQ